MNFISGYNLNYERVCRRHATLLTPHKHDSAQCGVMWTNAESACRRHDILLTPHKHDSAQCGVMRMNAESACRRHATMTPNVD